MDIFNSPNYWHCSRDDRQPVRAQRSCTPPRILPLSCISQCPAARLLSELYSQRPTFLPPEASQWARAQRDDAGGSTHSMTWWECTWITKQRTMPEIPFSCLSWFIFLGVNIYVASNSKFNEQSGPAEGDLTQIRIWGISAGSCKSKGQINWTDQNQIKKAFAVLIKGQEGLL